MEVEEVATVVVATAVVVVAMEGRTDQTGVATAAPLEDTTMVRRAMEGVVAAGIVGMVPPVDTAMEAPLGMEVEAPTIAVAMDHPTSLETVALHMEEGVEEGHMAAVALRIAVVVVGRRMGARMAVVVVPMEAEITPMEVEAAHTVVVVMVAQDLITGGKVAVTILMQSRSLPGICLVLFHSKRTSIIQHL